MAILLTFDLDTSKMEKNDHGRLQSMFERFGWQSLEVRRIVIRGLEPWTSPLKTGSIT